MSTRRMAPGRRPSVAETPTPESVSDPYVTVVFDSDDDYVRFTDDVDARFGAGAWDVTDKPILTSIRVRRDVLQQSQGSYAMHEFGPADQDRIAEQAKPQKWPFDADFIKRTPIPGVPNAFPEKHS
jgi:hypothetical protein